MNRRALLPTVAATIASTASWALVTYLIKGQVDWLPAIAFAVPFALIFGVVWSRWFAKRKG